MRRVTHFDQGPDTQVHSRHTEDAGATKAYPRVVIEAVSPSIEEGTYPAKSTLDEPINISCVAFCDDHDVVDCRAYIRHETEASFMPLPMEHVGNDAFRAVYCPKQLGRYFFYVSVDINPIRTCILRISRCENNAAASAIEWERLQQLLRSINLDQELFAQIIKRRSYSQLKALASDGTLTDIWFSLHSPTIVSSAKMYEIEVESQKARFSSWYEFFPRSTSDIEGKHGTFKDCERTLSYVAKMGFDVVYLPPIHPIGQTKRKGKNNSLKAKNNDVGSPWAIGSDEGGHKSIHPELGTLLDFQNFVAKAKTLNIDVALDLAFQCSPDHPYIMDHPEWFKKNFDGSLAHAENPPKRYQDIYPFDFHSPDWPALYHELKSIVTFWIEQGIRIFRVDNPHTKAFHFWKWLISSVRAEHGDVLFLSEAFTRPHIAYHLAKIGFSQSYTYFTWRHTKHELQELIEEYLNEPQRFFFRPNLWPNTPDILNSDLQNGSRATFIQRLILAATLSPAYGIYGPAFETMMTTSKEKGSEEYRDSEKYELKHHEFSFKGTLAPLIQRINQIRRDNSALQYNHEFKFIETQNESVIAYTKFSPVDNNAILTVVNLDRSKTQTAIMNVAHQTTQLHDLIGGHRITFTNGHGSVTINPAEMPACIFRVHQQVRREKDFDYFA